MTYFERWLSNTPHEPTPHFKNALWKHRNDHGNEEPLPDWPSTPSRVYRVSYQSPSLVFTEETEIENPIPSNEMGRILLDSMAIVWDGHVHAAMLLACRLTDPFHARYTPQTILEQQWNNACPVESIHVPDPQQTICSLYDPHGAAGLPIHLENKVLLDSPALRHWPFPLHAARYCLVPIVPQPPPTTTTVKDEEEIPKSGDKKRKIRNLEGAADEVPRKPQKKAKKKTTQEDDKDNDDDVGDPKKKKKKGPRKPRTPLEYYTSERFAALRKSGELDPAFSNNYLKAKKSMAEPWESMLPEEQAPFHDLAKQDVLRYAKEMKQFQQEQNTEPASIPFD